MTTQDKYKEQLDAMAQGELEGLEFLAKMHEGNFEASGLDEKVWQLVRTRGTRDLGCPGSVVAGAPHRCRRNRAERGGHHRYVDRHSSRGGIGSSYVGCREDQQDVGTLTGRNFLTARLLFRGGQAD